MVGGLYAPVGTVGINHHTTTNPKTVALKHLDYLLTLIQNTGRVRIVLIYTGFLFTASWAYFLSHLFQLIHLRPRIYFLCDSTTAEVAPMYPSTKLNQHVVRSCHLPETLAIQSIFSYLKTHPPQRD